MEKRRFTKVEIIDAIVAEATKGLFTGDNRDGEAPPITRQNFHSETFRYGARALRARLSRLSHAELLREYFEGTQFDTALQEHGQRESALMEHKDREAAAQARSRRQAELGSRPRRQAEHAAFLATARHHRGCRTTGGRKTTSREAWNAIKQASNTIKKKDRSATKDVVVVIEGEGKSERMYALSPDGTKIGPGIKLERWVKAYWRAAARPTSPEPG